MIVFAHGLYLDELLWFVIPVGLALWAMKRTERRARARAEAENAQDQEEGTD
ncbi:MAG TPA: hypothetical protein VLB67_06790 [Acidimicrobiia bacterium]|nr:hypothetical protein [Acidimicrobiia bacterium]